MVGHGGSSAGSYLADPTSPIPSHCASIVVTSTLRVNLELTVLLLVVNCCLKVTFLGTDGSMYLIILSRPGSLSAMVIPSSVGQ